MVWILNGLFFKALIQKNYITGWPIWDLHMFDIEQPSGKKFEFNKSTEGMYNTVKTTFSGLFFCSSISLSSVESGSPEQTVPHGSSMAVDTVHIVRKSHCFGFTPVREPSTEMQTTDSETSDIIEMSDGHEVTSSSTLVSASGDQTSSSFPHIKQTQVWEQWELIGRAGLVHRFVL